MFLKVIHQCLDLCFWCFKHTKLKNAKRGSKQLNDLMPVTGPNNHMSVPEQTHDHTDLPTWEDWLACCGLANELDKLGRYVHSKVMHGI